VLIDSSASLLSRAVLEDALDVDIAVHVIGQMDKACRYLAQAVVT
jgi:hypothetical protein